MTPQVGFNVQAEEVTLVAGTDVPVVAIVHDDMPDPLRIWQDVNVWAYRAMSPYSNLWTQLPQGSRFISSNEADMPNDPGKWAAYLDQVNASANGIVTVFGASNTQNWPADGEWPEDPTLKSKCYFYALHIPTFATVDQVKARVGSWTNPWCVTEVEADPFDPAYSSLPPDDPQRLAALRTNLLAGARAAIAAGAQFVALWGESLTDADAVRDPLLLQAVIDLNKELAQGDTPMASPTPDEAATIDQLEKQNALLTEVIKAVRTQDGQMLDTLYCALKGGLAAPDYSGTWPAPVPNS